MCKIYRVAYTQSPPVLFHVCALLSILALVCDLDFASYTSFQLPLPTAAAQSRPRRSRGRGRAVGSSGCTLPPKLSPGTGFRRFRVRVRVRVRREGRRSGQGRGRYREIAGRSRLLRGEPRVRPPATRPLRQGGRQAPSWSGLGLGLGLELKPKPGPSPDPNPNHSGSAGAGRLVGQG